MLPFQDRENELGEILKPESPIFHLYGEKGIGKTRLLQTLEKTLAEDPRDPTVLSLNFTQIMGVSDNRAQFFHELRCLLETAKGIVIPATTPYVQIINRIESNPTPVFLLFDDVQCMQNDKSWLHWLEETVVRPLAVGNGICQVYSGTIPLHFNHYDIRTRQKNIQLLPLKQEHVKAIVDTIFNDPTHKKILTERIYKLSNGYPWLMDQLVGYYINHPNGQTGAFQENNQDELASLCEEYVSRFFWEFLFSNNYSAEEKEIIEWICFLGIGEESEFQVFLTAVSDHKVLPRKGNYSDLMADLHRAKYIEWENGKYQVKPGIRCLMHHYLELIDSKRYHRGCEAMKSDSSWNELLENTAR